MYKIIKNKLIIYPSLIEDNIKKEIDIDLYYESFSNTTMILNFYLYDNINFKNVRSIKKYFLYNIPFVIDVEFTSNYITIKFTRKNGLDVLDVIDN